MKAAPSRRWPTASFRRIRKRPAGRIPDALSSSTVSWPVPTAAPKAIIPEQPFMPGTKQQGPQSPDGPAATYRKALAALDRYCQSTYQGKRFADLADEQKNELLKNIEDGKTKLDGADGKSFFTQAHQGRAGGILRRSASMAATATWSGGK